MNALKAFGDVILERLVRNKDFIELVVELNVSWLTGSEYGNVCGRIPPYQIISSGRFFRSGDAMIANRRAKGGADGAPKQSQRCNRVCPYFYYIIMYHLLINVMVVMLLVRGMMLMKKKIIIINSISTSKG